MSPFMARWVPPASIRIATFGALAMLVLGLQVGGRAQTAETGLTFATGYTVTGDYVVGGVDLSPAAAADGVVTGTVQVSGVPANADVVAAFLYWETIEPADSPAGVARFRGEPLTVVKTTERLLDGAYAACWASGGGPFKLAMHRADVRRLLPVQLDATGAPTGKRLVNSLDVVKAGFAPHTVTVPQAAPGQIGPQSAGASLVVVYRDPARPLTRVVLYDGLHIEAPDTSTTTVIRGFLQSAASPLAKVTPIVGSGAANTTDLLEFGHNGATSLVARNPFVATADPSTNRAWNYATHDVSALMPGADPGTGFGEEVSTTVTHTKASPYDCLAWVAIAFSTTVRDVDNDGLIDTLEDVSGLRQPTGEPLPDIHAMGAGSDRRDLFLEINAMQAAPGTAYGSARAPFAAIVDGDPANDTLVDPRGHNHMPTPAVLKVVGDTLAAAPADAAGGVPGIRLHADVGPAYHALGAAYASTEADAYLVPAALARGGESILETACLENPSATPPTPCLFPDYPGTVGWKLGFQLYRDARIDAEGRRRFDANRFDVFHYALYAHAGGIPRSPLACLDAEGRPTAGIAPLPTGHPCGDTLRPNPAFHVPTSASGRGDLPGGDFIVSLGLWDNERFVGSEFVQASTTLHELGHNLDRWHGGPPPTFTPVTAGGLARLNVAIEPNCKPNYLSVMSYLFQVNGLVDDAGVRHVDYSGGVISPGIDETSLAYGSLPVPLPYRTSWFAPLAEGTLGRTLGARAVGKYCSGQKFPDPLPAGWEPVGRIDAASRDELVDWNADGLVNESQQDVNFDGRLSGAYATPPAAALTGANDWANLRLNQIGVRRNVAGYSAGLLGGYVDGGYVDGGYVDGGYVDGGYVDGGYVDGGYVDGGYVDGGYVDGGYVDGGYVDGGYVDGGYVDGGITGEAELTFELASDLWGYAPPSEVRACVIDGVTCLSPTTAANTGRVRLDWKLPHAGSPLRFFLYRVQGDRVTPASVVETVAPADGIAVTPGQAAFVLVDGQELPDGRSFTYFAKALFPDGADQDREPELSIASNHATITARSVPPTIALAFTTAPQASGWFTSAPVGVMATATDNAAVAAVACTDNGSTITGTVVGLGSATASLAFAVSGDGTHALACTATDGAGNTATASATARLDTVGPVTTITSQSAAGFAFSATDATSGVASFECQWDAGGFAPCTSPVSAAGLPAWPHTFAVRAVDVAGNVGAPATGTLSSGYLVTPQPIAIKSSAQLGSAVPIAFQVRNPDGSLVTSTDVVTRIDSVYQGATCPAGSTAGTTELIYRYPDFSTGRSSLRFVEGSRSLQFNWDTSSAATAPTVTGSGCYVVLVYLNDGAAPRRTTPLLLR